MSSNHNVLKNGENQIKSQKRNNTNIHSNENQSDNNQSIISSKVDLSEIEATEDNLKHYTLSKQFLKLDLDKIRELIEILEEYCQTCVEKEDINLAKTARQRIILLKRIEKEKMMIEAKKIYSNQRELVQDKMKEELDNYKSNSDQEYESLTQGLETQEAEMLKTHQDELDEYKKNFYKIYEIKKPRPSKECLNWIKIKEYAIKQNKFNKAQEALREINKLNEKDNLKFKENKEKKLIAELNKIIHRHENEKNGFEMKKNSIIEEFNQNKNRELEKIRKKYESKLNELKNYQNFEISNFDKITKGVIKPCSRIQSIVSSTTGIKEEQSEEEKNKKEENEEKKNDNKNENKEKDNEREGENENNHKENEVYEHENGGNENENEVVENVNEGVEHENEGEGNVNEGDENENEGEGNVNEGDENENEGDENENEGDEQIEEEVQDQFEGENQDNDLEGYEDE